MFSPPPVQIGICRLLFFFVLGAFWTWVLLRFISFFWDLISALSKGIIFNRKNVFFLWLSSGEYPFTRFSVRNWETHSPFWSSYFHIHLDFQLPIRCRSPLGRFTCEVIYLIFTFLYKFNSRPGAVAPQGTLPVRRRSLSLFFLYFQLWIWCRSPLGHFTSETFFLISGELENKSGRNCFVPGEGFFLSRNWTYLQGQMMRTSVSVSLSAFVTTESWCHKLEDFLDLEWIDFCHCLNVSRVD